MVAAGLSAILLLTLFSAGSAAAQTPGGRGRARDDSQRESNLPLRGKVVTPSGQQLAEPIKVTLRDGRGSSSNFSYTDSLGMFEFRVTPGEYTVEAEPERDSNYEPVSERVLVRRFGSTSSVTLYLKEKRAAAKGEARPSSVVSAGELAQRVPPDAAKSFNRATAAAREGRRAEAIAHFRKAIAIFPGYLMARNDLGAQLLEEGEYDAAAEQLRAAVEIDPKAFNPQLNLGIVRVRQHNFPDALTTLDKALSLDASSPAAHLFAGVAAAALEQAERAEKEFRAAYTLGGKPFAIALYHLGELYMAGGQREPALRAFESYLREVPDATNAPRVQKLIGMLR